MERVEFFYESQLAIYKCFGLFDLTENASPRQKTALKFYFWHVGLFWMLLFDISMWIKIIGNINDMNEVIKVFYLFSMSIAVMAKFIRIKIKNRAYMELFDLMHTTEFMPANPDEAKKFHESIKLSRLVSNGYKYLSLTSLTFLFVAQLVETPDELPLSIYVPLNIENMGCFIFMWFYQVVALALCCFMNIAFDSLGASFFIYLKSQLDMLALRLQHIGTRPMRSEEFVNFQLKDCVRFYLNIVEMSRSIEDLVSIPMSVQIMSSVLVLVANFCAISFLTDPGDYTTFLKYFIYQCCMLTQIFILCYFANEVSLKSLELSYALYSSEWITLGKENRKLMLMMMRHFDTPFRIKTINGCYSFNLATFTSIVNSSYSYFALLKNMDK